MPLIKSGSREAVSSNIREMIAAGHPRRQAIAAALSTARRYGKKYADGGDVPDDTDRSLEQAYDPQAKTMRVTIRPNSIPESAFTTPEIVEAARQKYGPKGKGEPIWQAPPPSTYWQATHSIDTGESPPVPAQTPPPEPQEPVVDPRGQQYVASQPWADPMSGEIAASPEAQRAFARAVGARGEERVHLAPEQLLVDPVRKLYDLARSGKFDPGVAPTEETAGAAMDVAASLAGGVRVGQAIHPGMIPSGSIGMHGSNIDWARFEKEIAELISPLGSHGPMKAMEPHKASWIDSSHFEKLSGAKGSNPGGMYRDPETAEEWYIKKPQSIDHLKNEVLANKLYQLAGVPVPDLRHTTMQVGDQFYPALASRMVKGQTLNNFPPGDINEMLHLKENFPIDAWLANWDAVGSGKDNIVVNPITMEAHRIDAGGALNYRAQGSPKGKDFGNDVPELKTMLDPKKSPDAALVFQGADKLDVGGDAAKRLADISPSDLAKVINEWGPGTVFDKSNLYDKLMLRRKAVVDHYASQPIEPPPEIPYDYSAAAAKTLADPKHIANSIGAVVNDPVLAAKMLVNDAKNYSAEAAIQAKLMLPAAQKKAINKALWGMKNAADSPEEAEFIGSLFADKKFPTPPKNVSKADTPKAVKDYDKEVEEYYQALDEQDQHQYEIAQGPDLASAYPKENPNAPGPNEVISHHEFSKLTDEQVHNRFVHQLTKIKNWREWKPSYKTYTTPKLSKVQPGFAKLLGFNTEVTFYKGGVHGYEGHFPDPAKKVSEPGFFLADTEDVARSYAKSMDTPIDQYVVRAEKPGEIDWRKFTGGSHWDPAPMTKLIHQAKKEGLDILIIHNIEDVGIGKQTQYVVLNTNGTIRSVNAEFNPAKIGHGHSHWVLPAATAGAAGYGMAQEQEGEPMKKFASGGSTPFHERAYNEAIGAPTGIAEPGVRHFATPHVGMIHSPVPGRTDKLSMNVRGGSYILPASVVSGIGQGNSQAGASILNSFFKQGPYGASAGRVGAPKINFGKTMNMRMPTMRMPKFASGGTEEDHGTVPIVAAGGEYALSPEVVKRLGGGDMKKGHEILDNFVNHMRRKTIQDMKREKPPKR